jgi:hypothetical protein
MRVSAVRPWRHQNWTQLYEAALFERDTLRLWTRIWTAELAILERKSKTRHEPLIYARERTALKKAHTVLRDLRRLSNLEDPIGRAS